MVLKNTRVLINIFTLLEYLAYECELSLYSQISTKEFLFRISGLLMNKEITQEVLFFICRLKIKLWKRLSVGKNYFDHMMIYFQCFFSSMPDCSEMVSISPTTTNLNTEPPNQDTTKNPNHNVPQEPPPQIEMIEFPSTNIRVHLLPHPN
jgi:hypothetical protein